MNDVELLSQCNSEVMNVSWSILDRAVKGRAQDVLLIPVDDGFADCNLGSFMSISPSLQRSTESRPGNDRLHVSVDASIMIDACKRTNRTCFHFRIDPSWRGACAK